MAEVPLLAEIDSPDEAAQFVVIWVDWGAGAIRKSSGPLTKAAAHEFFENLGEDGSIITKRFESARENKGRV